MDIVITYVDGNDPLWREDYERCLNVPLLNKRYRDWGTLRYLFRGIEKYMPYIRNVYLVVSRESQLPSWISDKVIPVMHRDIIPSRLLPVFNSAAIEMFLHRIPGLGEEYIYFNDDIFPIMESRPEDFFRDGKAAVYMNCCLFAPNLYKKHTRNSDALAREAAGLQPSHIFLRPQHICAAMLRSSCAELYAKKEEQILSSVSPLREAHNLNQYLYSDYQYHCGRSFVKRISCKHISLAVKNSSDVRAQLENPTRKFMCVNDVDMSEERFLAERHQLLLAFSKHFPSASRFEK